jgi:outer membrane protein OmpA-like peptidoglycan-associated protein
MRRNVAKAGVQAVIIGSMVTFSMLGQAPWTRPEAGALRRQAETAAGRGEWSDAAALYRSGIGVAGESSWALRGLADIYRANGVWDKAAERYEELAAVDSADAEAKQLAALSRQALAEARAGFVGAATFRAMAEFPWSWLRNVRAQSKDLGFQSRTQASKVQRIPIQAPFPRDRFTLDSLPPSATSQLEEVATIIRTSTDRLLKIEVEGHTCRCGSDVANRELGRKRAEAVRQFLIARRAAPQGDITAISFGSSRPVESAGAPSLPAAVCERDEIHSENRRVVIVVYGQANTLTRIAPNLNVSFLSRRGEASSYELLSDRGQLRTGDEYRIRLRAETSVYVYAFHRGSSGKWDVLFPEKQEGTQSGGLSNPLESGREVSIPFVLTGDPGKEETYVYSRPEPDEAMETLVRNIQTGQNVKLLAPALAVREVTVQPRTGQAAPGARPDTQIPVVGRPIIPKAVVGDEVTMRDVTRLQDFSRLPPDIAGFVRFDHLK